MAEQITYAEVKFKDHPQGRVSFGKDRERASLEVPLPTEDTLHEYLALARQPKQERRQRAAGCSRWVYATILFGILCLLLAILSIVQGIFWPSLYCPKGWALWNTTCYYKSTEKQDWASSLEDCVTRGAHLVTTYDNTWEFFKETPFWVGAVATKQNEVWFITKNVLSVESDSDKKYVNINGNWYNCGAKKDPNAHTQSLYGCGEKHRWICERAAALQPLDEDSELPTQTSHGGN